MLVRFTKVTVVVAAVAGVLVAAAGVRTPPASATGSPITLAYITSLTGPGAPEDAGSQAGFLARIAMQNAEGGVHGHKLVPMVIDDQSNPTTVTTGVQEAISKGALGIVSNSGLFFLAAKYPEQTGVPVTGFFGDGPEWGEQPYTNMFASDHGSVDPKYPVNTLLGTFLKQHGGTVLASYGYSHLAAVGRGAAWERRLVPARRGQGRRAQHHRAARQRRLHDRRPRREAGRRERPRPQPGQQLAIPRSPRPSCRPA